MKAKLVDDDIFEHYKEGHLVMQGISADLEIIPNTLYEKIDNDINLKYSLYKKYPNGIYMKTEYGSNYIPQCIIEKNVYSMIIKNRFYSMPSFDNLTICFEILRIIYLKKIQQGTTMFQNNYIDYEMFKDFEWDDVKKLISKTFKDIDIYIFVCKGKGDNNEY